MEATFHDLSEAHLDKILEIEHLSFKTPWSRFAFIHEIELERSVFKVMEICV